MPLAVAGQARKSQLAPPVGAWLRIGAAQHGEFLAEDQDLGVFGRCRACEERDPSGDPDEDQLQQAQRHEPAILPAA